MPDAEPMIIDDGGSTRIKQLKDGAKMDDLLGTIVMIGGVPTNVFKDKATDPFTDSTAAGAPFKCGLKIRFHEKDGQHHIVPPPPLGSPAGTPSGLVLFVNDKIEIESQNGQKVTLSFDGAGTRLMVIALTASVSGIDPIVEAKSTGVQRRYVVTNAGPIQTVKHIRGTVTTLIFDAVATPSIYTMIHLRPRDL